MAEDKVLVQYVTKVNGVVTSTQTGYVKKATAEPFLKLVGELTEKYGK